MNLKSRNPWPIAIAGFFVAAVVFLATFIGWAVSQREDLVSANYYENEIRFQQQLDSMNRSQAAIAGTSVTFDSARRTIVIAFPREQSKGANGNIHLYRPSDARLDRDVPLALNPAGVQRLDVTQLRDGLWKVSVKWNANGKEFFLEKSVVLSSPKI